MFRPLPRGSQKLFLSSKAKVRALLGGNGSGKSITGAYAAAQYLKAAPPRPGCPFWVIAKSYEMCGSICWSEKLKPFIHPSNILWTTWLDKSRDWPSAIRLKNGWVIEFKSWEQGRAAFQARSIGGAWFDEQFPQDVFLETFARTRDYNSPLWFTLTPISPDVFLQDRYDNPPDGWEWFSLDLEDNRKSRGGHVSDEWVDAFIAEVPEDFRDVRIRGKFAGFQGAVYKTLRRELHTCRPMALQELGRGTIICAIDFGFNNPFVCLWIHISPDDIWTIFDEYYQARKFLEDHVNAIKSRGIEAAKYWADPEAAQDRAELARLGIPTATARKDVRLGIEAVQRRLMIQANGFPRLRICSNCKNTVREMFAYKWEENSTARKEAGDDPVKKNDHTCDAARYAVLSEEKKQWVTPSKIAGSAALVAGYSSLATGGTESLE